MCKLLVILNIDIFIGSLTRIVPLGGLESMVKVLLGFAVSLLEKFLDKVCENFKKKGGYIMENKSGNKSVEKEVILKALNKTSMSMLLVKL